jgi:hypothetical protein
LLIFRLRRDQLIATVGFNQTVDFVITNLDDGGGFTLFMSFTCVRTDSFSFLQMQITPSTCTHLALHSHPSFD